MWAWLYPYWQGVLGKTLRSSCVYLILWLVREWQLESQTSLFPPSLPPSVPPQVRLCRQSRCLRCQRRSSRPRSWWTSWFSRFTTLWCWPAGPSQTGATPSPCSTASSFPLRSGSSSSAALPLAPPGNLSQKGNIFRNLSQGVSWCRIFATR